MIDGVECSRQAALEEAIIAGELETFLKVCFERNFQSIDERFVFKIAFAHDKRNFVLEFCRCRYTKDGFKVALELSIEKAKGLTHYLQPDSEFDLCDLIKPQGLT